MPRGAKRTVDVLIADVDAKIAKKENELKNLRAQRAELENAHQTELASKVLKLASEKGVSIESLLQKLEQK